jgi:Uma2 family endonuclease
MLARTVEGVTADNQLKMSYEEYLEWADEDTRAEWVDGEVIVFMPAKNEHEDILDYLHRLIGFFVEIFDLGLLRQSNLEVKLWPGGPSRLPDLLFLKKEHLSRLTSERLNGPADLIIEVISRDSVRRDREKKYREYAKAGVPEYWIIDPRPGRHRADFYVLDETGQYTLHATEDDEVVESLILPGFRLKPEWLWLKQRPNVAVSVSEMKEEAADTLQALLNARKQSK